MVLLVLIGSIVYRLGIYKCILGLENETAGSLGLMGLRMTTRFRGDNETARFHASL